MRKSTVRETKYNWRILKAFFQKGQDVGDMSVLVQLAADVGLDPGEFDAALRDHRHREEHQKALRHTYEEAGITAVPTFIIGESRLQGLQSKETLIEAMQSL